jgi:hypothetical protein
MRKVVAAHGLLFDPSSGEDFSAVTFPMNSAHFPGVVPADRRGQSSSSPAQLQDSGPGLKLPRSGHSRRQDIP